MRWARAGSAMACFRLEIDSVRQLVDKVKYFRASERAPGAPARLVTSLSHVLRAIDRTAPAESHVPMPATIRDAPARTVTHATALTPAAAILCAYRFAADGTPSALAVTEIDDALAAGGAWFWIHLALADTRCRLD